MTEGLATIKTSESVFASLYVNGADILWPITLTLNDAELQFAIDISTSAKGTQIATQDIMLDQRQPFVVSFDCSSLQIIDIKYY
jgi:hypothetical protein